jgi:hypothetical protein
MLTPTETWAGATAMALERTTAKADRARTFPMDIVFSFKVLEKTA